MDYKWYAALAYVRANRLNHNVIEGPNDRFGIIASGKAYNDTRQALADLGLDDETCRALGIRAAQGRRASGRSRRRSRATSRAGLRRDPGRRGEAPGHRVPAQGRALQLAPRRAPERARQVRRDRRRRAPAANGARPNPAQHWLLRAQADLHAGDHRQGDRQAADEARRATRDIARAHGDAHRPDRGEGAEPGGGDSARRRSDRRRRAHAVVLLGLPAQHLAPRCPKARARWPASAATTWRCGWTARTVTFTPDGRRRRAVGRPGAVHHRQAHLRQPRRRHLLPLGPAGDPPGDRGRR